jgi:hypothetical protein
MIDGRSMPFLSRSASTSQIASLANGFPAAPQEILKYRGGRTIRDLSWINIYVGGQPAWDPQDWRNIDNTLAAAMSDEHLNNVVRQYFNNQPLKNSFKGSYFLAGWKPTSVSKVELERQLAGLHAGGAFNGMDLPNTVVNFMLPRGTVLGDPTAGMEGAPVANNGVPDSGTGDSTGGLGGYHGSVRAKNGESVYYAVGVFSERLPNGGSNGIPVFDQNWKNVVATFYHQLQEARTDPDVAEAVPGNGPNPSSWLGWTSDSGHEIGDYAITAAQPLSLAFREVPLADGSGFAPIQLLYSNAVQGPQGPIAYPNGMQPPPDTKPPVTNPPITNPPVTNDPELAKLVASWNELEDFVKKAIIRLANSK